MIGPPLPPTLKSKEEEEDMIGPPLPPSMKSSHEGSTSKQGRSRDDDDDDDDEDDEEEDVMLNLSPIHRSCSRRHLEKS